MVQQFEKTFPELLTAAGTEVQIIETDGFCGAGTPAKAGYPSIVVPGGTYQNVVDPPFPEGFNATDGPAGVTYLMDTLLRKFKTI